MKWLLDTNIIIHALNGVPAVRWLSQVSSILSPSWRWPGWESVEVMVRSVSGYSTRPERR
jgi:predicted nucleic acid-binding protein